MSAHEEDDQMRALLAPLDDIEPVTRRTRRRSAWRLALIFAAGTLVLAAAGAAIAGGLGAFSGPATIADVTACKTTTGALTTASGAQVLTGHTEKGVYCVAYKDANGAVASTAATLGAPVGQAVAEKALDTASNTYVVAGVVPPGYNQLSIAGKQIPIQNQAFVIDPQLAGPGSLSGPAGTAPIDLSEFGGP